MKKLIQHPDVTYCEFPAKTYIIRQGEQVLKEGHRVHLPPALHAAHDNDNYMILLYQQKHVRVHRQLQVHYKYNTSSSDKVSYNRNKLFLL